MRVLNVHSGNLYGGVETLMMTIARMSNLSPAIEFEFAIAFEGRLANELRDAGAIVHTLGKVRTRRPDTVWRARRRLGGLLRERRIDAAICHMAWSQAIFGPVVNAARVPLVFWAHDATSGRHWLDLWARLTLPRMVLCNSQFTAGTLENLYPQVPREVVLYPVAARAAKISESEPARIRAEFDTPADSTVIIQASRMEPWKGHRMHLEALGRLRAVPGWTCWIAGGAQRPHEVRYRNELEAESKRLGIASRVRFIGYRSDLDRIFTAADIYCQPNAGPEPFGIVFVEALGAGLPVITVSMGGAIEIVDESCGILVPPEDVAALAGALLRLIESPGERSRLALAGPSRARQLCDPAAQMNRLAQVLATALAMGMPSGDSDFAAGAKR